MPVVQCSQNDDLGVPFQIFLYNTTSACKMFTRGGCNTSRSDINNMVTIWSAV